MDEAETKIDKIRLKQYNCKHPSWKCSCCGLYKDNHNQAAEELHLLHHYKNLAVLYKKILESYDVPMPNLLDLGFDEGILK